ncbi:DUF4426 domain-containing protein [Halomonas sp. M4R1S46]|uniref:DUF4426 domain-containing protein n=1 Tax=Halomonas sp. M4R1S46 TaxID=2982692 RepID=UPI0021E45510|nr:DUF4426 domain-containing protein [Halomonas sp. M4R1S46]UYG07969.1 DUF4426 domain-containing protein [Halomonas sp. M4R1S46]
MTIRQTLGALATGLLLAAPLAQAQQFEQVGDYQIHYNALNTSFLAPEVATAAGIQRSRVTGMLNVSVLQEQDEGAPRAVNARVDGQVSGLTGQPLPLRFRTVRDGDSVYHIATFRIHEGEPMRFELEVAPDRNAAPVDVSFIQRFYIDR